jgi:hypothetical protein
MAEEILVCLDGSRLAEKILPLAQGIGDAKRSAVVLLRFVGSSEELQLKRVICVSELACSAHRH